MPSSISFTGKRRPRPAVLAAVALLLLLAGCAAGGRRPAQDPYYETFYEKARLIMTPEEEQIYKHLPDDRAKEEFIEEFWRKRDPVAETEENENKVEFERRIAYANRWFKENRASGRGWDTQRGRILIQLGEPDNRILNEMTNSASIKGYERWLYYDHQLELIFVDSSGFGEYRLQNWPPELLTAIDNAKFALSAGGRDGAGKGLLFTCRYRDGQVVVAIPLKRVRFSEENGTIRADYRGTISAYRDYVKVAVQPFSKQLAFAKDDLPTARELSFAVPFPLQARGKYYIEVILEDKLSGSRALAYIDFKL
jgi:GWxTD domain-containing protein